MIHILIIGNQNVGAYTSTSGKVESVYTQMPYQSFDGDGNEAATIGQKILQTSNESEPNIIQMSSNEDEKQGQKLLQMAKDSLSDDQTLELIVDLMILLAAK